MTSPRFIQGDPRRTRMRVKKIMGQWRVFELAQYDVGQRSSTHPDKSFITHRIALAWAIGCVTFDRRNAQKYGPDRFRWPRTKKRRQFHAD